MIFRRRKSATLAVLLTVFSASFAWAKGSLLDEAIALYKAKNYVAATAALRDCIQKGENTPTAWLYLGHAYSAKADPRAMQTYITITDRFADSSEANVARACLIRLDPRNKLVYTAAKLGSLAEPGRGDMGFVDRVSVYHSLPGHPRICQATVNAVKTAIASLPPQINKYLCDGKATLTIAPNISDRWPGSGDGLKPTDSTMTMGEEGARTYDRNIFIYERKKQRGVDVLLARYSDDEIIHAVYHEIGHAVDVIGGEYSSKPEFRKLLAEDLSTFTASQKQLWSYFLDPGEGFAETVAGLLQRKTAKEPGTITLDSKMPKVNQYVKKLFRL